MSYSSYDFSLKFLSLHTKNYNFSREHTWRTNLKKIIFQIVKIISIVFLTAKIGVTWQLDSSGQCDSKGGHHHHLPELTSWGAAVGNFQVRSSFSWHYFSGFFPHAIKGHSFTFRLQFLLRTKIPTNSCFSNSSFTPCCCWWEVSPLLASHSASHPETQVLAMPEKHLMMKLDFPVLVLPFWTHEKKSINEQCFSYSTQ